jgi:hypothetical protein
MQFDPLKRREFIALLGGATADMAARGACAAAGDGRDWLPQRAITKRRALAVNDATSYLNGSALRWSRAACTL